MKLLKVTSSQQDIINCCEHFHFNEFGELVNWKEYVVCFVSREDAHKTLIEYGMDELSVALMEFIEFDYVPPLPSEDGLETVIPNYSIYSNGIAFTTLGEDLTSQMLQDSLKELKECYNRR